MTSAPLPEGYELRELRIDDAPAFVRAYERNREHLAPWEPVRPASFYDLEGQTRAIEQRLQDQHDGKGASWVLLHDDDVVGRAELSNIVRGVFQSGSLGYWVDAAHTGRGLATAAVVHACQWATKAGLHRVEAATLVHNAGSQRVLDRCGFTTVGPAPAYLFIAGRWQDHLIFQRVLHDRPPG